MSEPLDEARLRLNITPATIYDSIPAENRDPATKLVEQHSARVE